MKKFALACGVVFTLLTLVGAAYVLSTGGRASPGYAVVPMVFALAAVALSRKKRDV